MKHNSSIKAIPRRVYVIASTLILAVVGAYLLTLGHAASIGSMSLSPGSSQVSAGSTFVVTVNEDSQTIGVNAAQVDLNYDATKLDFVSFDASAPTSAIPCPDPTNPNFCSGGTGTVKLGLLLLGSTVQGPQTLAKITFRAKQLTGPAAVSFASTSALIQPSTTGGAGTNILSTTTGATYTIADTTAPTAPTSLVPTAATTSIAVSWTAATDNIGVTGYKIFKDGAQIGTSTTTSYTYTGLAPLTNYTLAVSAYDAAGLNSTQLSSVVKTLADTAAPTTPTGLTVGAKTMTTVPLTWTASTDNVGVTGYKIFRGGTQVGTSATTSYTDTGLAPNTAYSYTVLANDAAGLSSAQTAAVSVTTLADTQAPTVPTGLSSPSQTSTSVTLSWTASTDNVGVTGYKIFRGGTQVGTSATTSYTNTGLTTGVSYSYTVAAYDAAGLTSAQTAAITISTVAVQGDIDGDGHVNLTDLSIMGQNYGKSGMTRAQGNLDGDVNGVVNIYDLSILGQNWGK